MRLLLIGSGGREHALAEKLKDSSLVDQLFCWPGNPYIRKVAKPLQLSPQASFAELGEYLVAHRIKHVISGPETPYAEGLKDELETFGIRVFGPNKHGAKLESSKSFAKKLLLKYEIPTAFAKCFENMNDAKKQALEIIEQNKAVVIKADGLASGKGVFVCKTQSEAEEAFNALLRRFSSASTSVLIEEYLDGRELSCFLWVGSNGPTSLGYAVDFKRRLDGDLGPNTGGMGAYSPVNWLTVENEREIDQKIVQPVFAALQQEQIPYEGFLYIGLMWTDKGPQIIEFNVRLGDPEAQVLAAIDSTDWGSFLLKGEVQLDTLRKCGVLVTMTSSSYPESEEYTGGSPFPEELFKKSNQHRIFVGNVVENQGALFPGAGRVLSVVGLSDSSFQEARTRAYQKVQDILEIWPEARFRRDIAARVVDVN